MAFPKAPTVVEPAEEQWLAVRAHQIMSDVTFFFGGWDLILRILVVGTLAYDTLIALQRISGKRTLALGASFGRISRLGMRLLPRRLRPSRSPAGLCKRPKARVSIGRYFGFYNSRRPRSSIGGRSSVQSYFSPLTFKAAAA